MDPSQFPQGGLGTGGDAVSLHPRQEQGGFMKSRLGCGNLIPLMGVTSGRLGKATRAGQAPPSPGLQTAFMGLKFPSGFSHRKPIPSPPDITDTPQPLPGSSALTHLPQHHLDPQGALGSLCAQEVPPEWSWDGDEGSESSLVQELPANSP